MPWRFIEEGLASVVEFVAEKGAVEVGVIGFEGMTGLAVLMGDTQSPFDTYMQCEGSALRIESSALRIALEESTTLRVRLMLYARAFTIQIATTAFANARSSLTERLARWLLMINDRMGNKFSITHEFLSTMLAVRRSGVTEALKALEGDGLIKTTRGKVEIVNRQRLIDATHGIYGHAELEYRRLLPHQAEKAA
jgi:CRP-like cAMP-binding protein